MMLDYQVDKLPSQRRGRRKWEIFFYFLHVNISFGLVSFGKKQELVWQEAKLTPASCLFAQRRVFSIFLNFYHIFFNSFTAVTAVWRLGVNDLG